MLLMHAVYIYIHNVLPRHLQHSGPYVFKVGMLDFDVGRKLMDVVTRTNLNHACPVMPKIPDDISA